MKLETIETSFANLLRRLFKNKNTDAILQSDEMSSVANRLMLNNMGVLVLASEDRVFYSHSDYGYTAAIRCLQGRGYHVEFYPTEIDSLDQFVEPLFTDGTVGPRPLAEAITMFCSLMLFNVEPSVHHLFKGAHITKEGDVVCHDKYQLHFAASYNSLDKYGISYSGVPYAQSALRFPLRCFDNGAVFFATYFENKPYVLGCVEDAETFDMNVYNRMIKDADDFIGIVPMNEVVPGQKISVESSTYLVAGASSKSLHCLDAVELDYEHLLIRDIKVCTFKNEKAV